MRIAALTLAGLLVIIGAVLLAVYSLPPRPERPAYRPTAFSTLPGWQDDGLSAAAPALERSCARIVSADPDAAMGAADMFGRIGDWQGVCRELQALLATDPAARRLRAFLEKRFRPVAVTAGDRANGLFTGYFTPEYPGSLMKTEKYDVPLYGRPRDLVTVDLGRFGRIWMGNASPERWKTAA